MNDINSIVLVGRLVRDVDVSYTQGGTAVGKLGIASNRSYKSKDGQFVDEVSYFDVTLFGKAAEGLKQYLTKGKQIAVSGYLKQDRWKDDGGNSRSKVSVVADSVQLLGGKPEASSDGGSGYQPKIAPARQQYGGAPAGGDGFQEDIPF